LSRLGRGVVPVPRLTGEPAGALWMQHIAEVHGQDLVDALVFFADQSVSVPNTGSIDGDLRQLARSVLAVLTDRAGQAIIRAMVAAGHHTQVANVVRAFWSKHTAVVAEIVARAVRRGELPTGTWPADISRAIGAPPYMRLLITAEPLDQEAADQSAAAPAAAARAGAYTTT
jgi:hypothetical protein